MIKLCGVCKPSIDQIAAGVVSKRDRERFRGSVLQHEFNREVKSAYEVARTQVL